MTRRTPALLEGLAPLLDQEIAALVPDQYAAWRPLVAGGLRFFLENLPERRLAAIVGEQLGLAFTATAAERLAALLRHSPTLHKLGQVIARDRRLDAELRRHLQTLESMPATTPMASVRRLIRRELGGQTRGLSIAPAILAEGSVAVVVPFSWEGGEGVFKVLKPGIEERLGEDLAIWARLAGYLETRGAELDLPALDYRDTLESVRGLLENEVRLDGEQAHLAAAARRHGDQPQVLVPALLPWSTPRMTAMERIHGVKVTEAQGLEPATRRRLAATLIEALLAQPFLSPAESAPFHADPHAGNLFLTFEGRLAILDWALVAEISKAQRQALLRLTLGALAQDGARVCQAAAALDSGTPDEVALRQAVEAALAEVRRGRFPGLDWALGLLDRLASRGALRFPEELVLLRKTLLTLQGVLADVDAGCAVDHVLARSALTRFLGELPARAASALDSRAFGCPISTADLLALALDTPAAGLRYWAGQWRDWSELWRPAVPILRS
jgi:ubiquinone biosynthesis protein